MLGECDEILEDIRKVRETSPELQQYASLVSEATEGLEFQYLERTDIGAGYYNPTMLNAFWSIPGRQLVVPFRVDSQPALPSALYSVVMGRASISNDYGLLAQSLAALGRREDARPPVQGTLYAFALANANRNMRVNGEYGRGDVRVVDAQREYILVMYWEFCSDAFRTQCVELWRSANLYENIVDRTQEKKDWLKRR